MSTNTNEGMEMEKSTVSRRSFLTSTAALGFTAAATGMLVGCSGQNDAQGTSGSQSDAAPSTDEATQASVENIAPLDPPAAWDEEYDVIVVGTGGGLFAAMRSCELGSNTLCIDKLSLVGGASQESSIFAVSGTDVQLEHGLPDIGELMLGSFLSRQYEGSARTSLITNIATNSVRPINWLGEMGFEWEPTTTGGPTGGVSGVSPKDKELDGLAARTNMYVYRFLGEQFENAGGTLKLNTTLTGLVQEDDAIVGIQVEDENGETKFYKAEKGVILSAGGMAANRDMLQKYVPSAYERVKCNSSGAQDTGEAIRMGLGAGAAFTGFDAYQAFDGGLDTEHWDHYLYNGDIQLARQAWLGIDCTGKRFPYYTAVAQYGQQARVLQCLPGAQGFKFFDSHYEEYAPTFDQECCRKLIVPTMPDVDRLPELLQDWTIGAKTGIEKGRIKTGDTIEEVAEQLGLDPQIVSQAVADWNEMVATGVDEEAGIPSEWLHPIVDAPFYGVAIGSIIFSTHAGLLTNDHMQVVSTKGTVLPGLYASGCTMGGCCGPDSNYGAGCNVNGGVAFAAITAFLAAEHINGQ